MTTSIDTTRIMNTLDRRVESDSDIQREFVHFATQLMTMSKKDICKSPKVAAVFAHPAIGRGYFKQVLTWFATGTPIRVKFKDNGHFDKVSMARKGKWDIEVLRSTMWFDYEKARTAKVAKASIDRGLQAFAREVARAVFESDDIAGTIDGARELIVKELFKKVCDEMETEKFNAWAIARQADMEAAQRKAKAEQANKSAAVTSIVNKLKAA